MHTSHLTKLSISLLQPGWSELVGLSPGKTQGSYRPKQGAVAAVAATHAVLTPRVHAYHLVANLKIVLLFKNSKLMFRNDYFFHTNFSNIKCKQIDTSV